jgi:hypothetical protein
MDKVAGVQAQVNDVTNIMKVPLLLRTVVLVDSLFYPSLRTTSTKCLRTTTNFRLAAHCAALSQLLAATLHAATFPRNLPRQQDLDTKADSLRNEGAGLLHRARSLKFPGTPYRFCTQSHHTAHSPFVQEERHKSQKSNVLAGATALCLFPWPPSPPFPLRLRTISS